MKIAVYLDHFSELSETFVYDQVKCFEKHGHEVLVLCKQRINADSRPLNKVIEIGGYSKNLKKRIQDKLYNYDIFLSRRDRRLKNNISTALSNFNPDVIHCHFGIQALNLLDNYDNSSIPIFITFHGYDASRLIRYKSCYRKRMKSVFLKKNIHPHFVANSLLGFVKEYQIESKNSFVNYLGVDTAFYKPNNETLNDSNKIIFTQISRFVEKKGHYYTLLAFQKFLQNNPSINAYMYLAGDGPRKNEIEKLAEDLNIKARVKFLGWIDNERKRNLLSISSIYVQHSITDKLNDTEGLPISILEAMAMGLPILSTNHSGIPEVIVSGKNGLLTEEKDITTMSKYMLEISSWDKLNINREKVLEFHSLDKSTNKLLERFKKAITL